MRLPSTGELNEICYEVGRVLGADSRLRPNEQSAGEDSRSADRVDQATALIASKATWAKQDAAAQKAIMDAWAHARAFNRKFILDEDKSIQDQVREKGVTITKPDATPFRQATQSVYEEFYATPAGKDAKKMVDFILAVK